MRRGAESQSHRCKEVHRGRGAAEQRRLEADDEVEDPPERSREEEAGEYGGCDEAARLEAAATRQVELLHVHGSGARGVVCRVRAVLERSGDVASMTWAEGDGRPALQRAERRHARAQARYEHARLAEHPCGRLGGAGGSRRDLLRMNLRTPHKTTFCNFVGSTLNMHSVSFVRATRRERLHIIKKKLAPPIFSI